MLARFTIYVFYAIVFFMLGAWAGDLSPHFHAFVQRGGAYLESGMTDLRAMAQNSIATPQNKSATASATSLTETLVAAREASAHGNVDQAIDLYGELLKQNPDSADAWGELGNVDLNAGRLDNAAHAFLSAGQARLRQDNVAGARALVPIIQRYDPALAGILAGQIAAKASPTKSE